MADRAAAAARVAAVAVGAALGTRAAAAARATAVRAAEAAWALVVVTALVAADQALASRAARPASAAPSAAVAAVAAETASADRAGLAAAATRTSGTCLPSGSARRVRAPPCRRRRGKCAGRTSRHWWHARCEGRRSVPCRPCRSRYRHSTTDGSTTAASCGPPRGCPKGSRRPRQIRGPRGRRSCPTHSASHRCPSSAPRIGRAWAPAALAAAGLEEVAVAEEVGSAMEAVAAAERAAEATQAGEVVAMAMAVAVVATAVTAAAAPRVARAASCRCSSQSTAYRAAGKSSRQR